MIMFQVKNSETKKKSNISVLTTIIINHESLAGYILDEQMPEHNSVCEYNLKIFAGPAETTLLPVKFDYFVENSILI